MVGRLRQGTWQGELEWKFKSEKLRKIVCGIVRVLVQTYEEGLQLCDVFLLSSGGPRRKFLFCYLRLWLSYNFNFKMFIGTILGGLNPLSRLVT